MFVTASIPAALRIALRLGIEYLYVDRTDVAAYPDGVRKFDEHPLAFEPVFANSEVRVFRIRH
jgi:hypothetical protein